MKTAIDIKAEMNSTPFPGILQQTIALEAIDGLESYYGNKRNLEPPGQYGQNSSSPKAVTNSSVGKWRSLKSL
ncbi:MAG: hypothetical protein KME16_25305 [Scytolyngbya sp. HA4215-MV1]|nr:hypothetical protein [Scytolyngbya sp. HA4215-MV1]